MKKVFVPSLLLLASMAFAGACGKADETALVTLPTSEAPNVAITKVTRSSIADYYEATGTVKAKTTTQVSANLMGRIVSFPVAEGDTVSRGQTLVEIDNRDAAAQLEKAQAGLKEAQASLIETDRSAEAARAAVKTAEVNRQLAEVTFGRYKQLYERKSASGQEFDEAQSRLNAAASELERARANVQAILSKKGQINARIEQANADIANTRVYASYSRIVSPVSGIVVKKFAESGAMASPGVPLLSIEDNSQYRLEVAVEESRSKLINVGNRVNVRVDAIGGGEFFATIAEVMPSADPASRSYTVKIDLPANPALKSGLFGVASFPLAQKEAITVPQTAVVQRGQLTGVYVIGEDGIAHYRIVTTGKTVEGAVEILSGLSEGDEIATSDVERIKDGTKVR